ncbi:serine/threonine protein kinase [Mucilaginibacter sp. RS28]|uniref:Serine/threonine protein kinase n=1 Tax=Mucilaginibacter straminoryzae TaxID=2932774 RepID=A0A9X1X627_9SPHI|nr:serine/threonine protein kinase [Mucilaginibacter straminoryzae]
MKVFTITEGLENLGALRTGGQGSVYKARRMGPILTAVKLIPTPIYNESEEDRNYRNFLNEVEKLKKVNEEPNPNVVKILSSGITESGSFPFIEMEYIEGPDLEELLKPPHERVFTIKEAVKLADQLACALSHCHKVGVRHGDIKSNNVKFNTSSGNYVLLDFGLAVMSDEQRRSSLRHAGAIEFMAPEQNEGKMLFQTDVYSFGVVLYELLAGQVPFPLNDSGETSRNAVMLQHMETPVPDLLTIRNRNLPAHWSDEKKERELQVPDWLLKVIYKCLEKKPENRFHDGVALHDAVSRQSISGGTNAELQAENSLLKQKVNTLEEGQTLSPNPALKFTEAKREAQKSRRIIFTGLSLIVILLITMITALRSASKKKEEAALLRDSVAQLQKKIHKDSVAFKALAYRYATVRRIQQTISASIKQDSIARANERKRATTATGKPKRRKKFLGLF